jgi:hypothetical protein
LQGKTYGPLRLVLDEERVRSFARAVGQEGDGLPPTMATVPELAVGLANVLADPELGVDLAQVLHTEQEYEWLGPIDAGGEIVASATIERIRERGSSTFLTLRTEILDASGEVLVRGRTTLVVRGDG